MITSENDDHVQQNKKYYQCTANTLDRISVVGGGTADDYKQSGRYSGKTTDAKGRLFKKEDEQHGFYQEGEAVGDDIMFKLNIQVVQQCYKGKQKRI